LSEGKIEYATTPISIWDKYFILIDEISRCNPQMQNKFLEIVLERQLMGIPTDIKWVWATMNPLTYPGSQPLDGALAGRMGYVLQVNPIVKAREDVLKRVVSSQSKAQAPALSYWLGDRHEHKLTVSPSLRAEYRSMLARAGAILEGLEDHWRDQVSGYLTAFAKSLENAGIPIDGRRLVMMRYNIVSNLAIQTVQEGRGLSMNEVKQLCKEVIMFSIPAQATGVKESFDASKIAQAHNLAADMLNHGDALLYRIVTEQDPLEKAMLLLENRQRLGDGEATNLVASIYEKRPPSGVEPAEQWAEEAKLFAIKLGLTQLFLSMSDIAPEAVTIVAKNYPLVTGHRYQQTELYSASAPMRNYREAVAITDFYLQYATGTSALDSAAAYFAFHTDKGPVTLADLKTRFGLAREALVSVANRFRSYLPSRVSLNVSSSYNAPDEPDQAAAANQTQAGGLPAGGTEGSFDRFVAVV
jgi:hypothetical protein